jgi:hypothetical protein
MELFAQNNFGDGVRFQFIVRSPVTNVTSLFLHRPVHMPAGCYECASRTFFCVSN